MAVKSKGNFSLYHHINKAKLLACFLTLLFCLQTDLFAAPYNGDDDGLTLLIEFPDEPATIPKAADAAESNTGSIRLTLSFKGGYNLAQKDAFDIIQMEEFALTSSPGDPMLPHKLHDILLPPDALELTVELNIVSAKTRTLDGTYNIKPAGPDAAWVDGKLVQIWGDDKTIVDGRNVAVYESDADFPKSSVKLLPYSQMRKWKFVRVDFSPFQYNPVSRKLTLTESVEIEISYKKSPAAVDMSLMADTAWDNIAARSFVNYAEAEDWYDRAMSIDEPSPSANDYVIITTNAIVANSNKLNNFIAHKESLGHSVLVVTYEDDIQSLTGQSPNYKAEKIRQWLIDNYASMSIEYVLLIGDPCPYESGEGDIPMKMCYPRGTSNNDDDYERAPTDYFYADLTGNWNFDSDQYYGEWDDDFGPVGGVDFTPEVYVGRIPVYDANYAALDSILQKIIDYAKEQYYGSIDWRDSILLPMGFQWSGYDGAPLAEQMRDDYLISAGYSTWRMYQQGTAYASDNSIYTSEEELRGSPSTPNVKDRWSSTNYGIVCWWAHGSATSASVGYGVDDGPDHWDGRLMRSSYTSSLDDDHPAFTYQCSCTNGHPETSNNLQYAILEHGGIATVGATRVSWFSTGVGYGDFDGSTTNSGIGYEYVDRLVQNLCAGNALYEAKSSMGPEDAADLMNWYDFNLYGDPAMSLTMTGDTSVLFVNDNAPNDPNWGDPNGSDPNEDGSFLHPYDSIQEALDNANDANIIAVLDGTYTGIGNYNIDPAGQAITIRAQNGPQKCSIDCQSNGRAFVFQNGEGLDTVLDGFTITGGYSSTHGGAIYCYGSSPTIQNCIMTDNYAVLSGGAIVLEDNSDALIIQCTIHTNNCGAGGAGICSTEASCPTIKNCLIADNTGKYSGGAGSFYESNMTFINCTIADNSATDPIGAGGIFCFEGDVTVTNTILWNNTSPSNNQIGLFGGETVIVDYSNVQMPDSNDKWGGVDSNNINADPLFADPNADPNNEDYHLKSGAGRWNPILYTNGDFNNDRNIDFEDLDILAGYWLWTDPEIIADLTSDNLVNFADYALFASNWGETSEDWLVDGVNSPCIDTGDPGSDYSLEPAPNGGGINMGAFGNTEFASKSP